MVQRMINNTEVSQTGVFANNDLDNTFNQRPIRARLFESYKKYAWGRKGIIYAINKGHAYNIASLYSSKGVKAIAIDCDTPKDERQDTIDAFRNGDIRVLVNVEIFTEGFDCTDVSFIQLARPTCSLALYLQQVGRGLRIEDGKEKTIIIDNVGLYNYFGLPDADRDWQYYFNGHEVEQTESERDSYGRLPSDKDVYDRFEEDNEEMVVVRGEKHDNGNKPQHREKVKKHLPIEEFVLCDYYLVHGNREHFSIYPFVKKRGKRTEDIGKCFLEYDIKKEPMTFTLDIGHDIQLLATNMKIQTVISFCAALCKISLRKLLEQAITEETNLFDLLKDIEKVMGINRRIL